MSGHRPERIADLVRAVLARTLREEVRDPRVGFVTVTGVEVSSDLRHARVFVAAHGDDATRAEALRALERASGFLRRALARDAGLRFAPDLRFLEDSAVERGQRVESLLRDLHTDVPPDETDS